MSSHTVIVDDSATDIIEYMKIELGPFRGKGWSTQTGPSLDEETEGPIHNSTLHVATVEDTSIVFPFNGELQDSPHYQELDIYCTPVRNARCRVWKHMAPDGDIRIAHVVSV